MEQLDSGELARALARMSAVLISHESVATAVQLVTALAEKALPSTAGAGVTLIDAVGKRTTAASDPLVNQADTLQYEFEEGPCLTAWQDRVLVSIEDVATERRWPRWTDAVAALGDKAMLSAPMVVADSSIGAIKVYSRQSAVYNQHSEQLLTLFAQQAAILLANVQSLEDAQQLSAQLSEALARRDVIGQAKGILISQGAPDEEAAFTMLVTASQRANIKLHEVARQLVADAAGGHAPPQL